MSGEGPDRIDLQGLTAWFDEIFARCERLVLAGSLPMQDVDIGGGMCRIHASGAARLAFILSRLATSPTRLSAEEKFFSLSGTDLGWRIPLWDQPDWHVHAFDKRLAAAGYKAHYPFFDRDWIVQRQSDGMAIHVVQDWADLRPWDGGAPLRHIVHWSAQRRRKRLIHAGTLAVDGRGVLLCGKGGSGKSGTVLSGLTNGLTSVGDDYILLDQAKSPRVERIYDVMKQDDAGLSRFPDLCSILGPVSRNWQGKVEFDPRPIFPGQIVDSIDLVAILLPRVSHLERSRFRAVDRREALDILTRAMDSEFFGEMTQTLFTMNRLSSRLPVYELSLSSDPADIAATIRSLIIRHGSVRIQQEASA